MSFDWQPESKDRYFRKAEAAVKAAGFDDILQISKEQFAITKSTVKVYFKPIPREGKTRRWWEAKKSINRRKQHENYCSNVTKGRNRENDDIRFNRLYVRRGAGKESACVRRRPAGRYIKDVRGI